MQPSPPPSPPLSQKYIQQGGRDTREKSASPLSPLPRLRSSLWQREVSEFIRNLESSDDSGDDDVTTDERDKMMTSGQMKINPENINFVFRSVRPDSHNAGARERVTGSVRAGKRGSARGSAKSGVMSQIDEEGDLEEDSILVYLTRELRDIQEGLLLFFVCICFRVCFYCCLYCFCFRSFRVCLGLLLMFLLLVCFCSF